MLQRKIGHPALPHVPRQSVCLLRRRKVGLDPPPQSLAAAGRPRKKCRWARLNNAEAAAGYQLDYIGGHMTSFAGKTTEKESGQKRVRNSPDGLIYHCVVYGIGRAIGENASFSHI
jgi:hypothetical protein